MVFDSGVTLNFVNPKENLPITGKSNKKVALPDGSTIAATHTTESSFTELTDDAQKHMYYWNCNPTHWLELAN